MPRGSRSSRDLSARADVASGRQLSPRADTVRSHRAAQIIEWSPARAVATPYRGMYLIKDESLFAPRRVFAWVLFSACAGVVNGGAWVAVRSFATHVTGAVTSVGLSGAQGEVALGGGLAIGAFFVGAMIAALIVDTLRARDRRAVTASLLLGSATLFGVAVAGQAGAFGAFGQDGGRGALALLALLSACMGAQNAAVGIATANAIRTTHATGPLTDLAVNVVRGVLGTSRSPERELRWAVLRALKIMSFAVGALAAAHYAASLGYGIFALAGVFSVLAVGCIQTADEWEEESAPADAAARASQSAVRAPGARP